MLEFYEAYADYRDLMNLTEEMLRALIRQTHGTATILYQGDSYDFAKPFARFTLKDSILHFNPDLKPADLDTLEAARRVAERLGIPLKAGYGLGKVQTRFSRRPWNHVSRTRPLLRLTRPRCRRSRAATTRIRLSPTGSSFLSVGARSRTAFPS
jgi:lysyl-tRNA synthetase class II